MNGLHDKPFTPAANIFTAEHFRERDGKKRE